MFSFLVLVFRVRLWLAWCVMLIIVNKLTKKKNTHTLYEMNISLFYWSGTFRTHLSGINEYKIIHKHWSIFVFLLSIFFICKRIVDIDHCERRKILNKSHYSFFYSGRICCFYSDYNLESIHSRTCTMYIHIRISGDNKIISGKWGIMKMQCQRQRCKPNTETITNIHSSRAQIKMHLIICVKIKSKRLRKNFVFVVVDYIIPFDTIKSVSWQNSLCAWHLWAFVKKCRIARMF